MNRKVFFLLLTLVIGVNMTGLLNEIFSMDSSLYAAISKSFAQSHDYINICVDGKDWLDKPHFPFWVCGLSIQIFGVNTFAYKFPSICFFLIGLFYTYRLAKSLYNEETAYLAVLILGSSLHIIVSNNDTRAEAILLGLLTGAVYHLYKITDRYKIRDLLLGSLFSAAAIMTKGIFILIVIYSAIWGNLIFKKDSEKLFNRKWILGFVLTIIFITPELYALYSQFDLHPEKKVFGSNNISGLRFFLWDSQFGRFFNTGPIKGESDIFFFFHTILWAVAPWAIIGLTGLIIMFRNILGKNKKIETLTFFGFIIMFLIFSVSKFQLPHYLNILIPFLAIIIASVLSNESQNNKVAHRIVKISIGLYGIAYIATMGLIEYCFKSHLSFSAVLPIVASIFLFGITYIYDIKLKHKYVVYGTLASIIFVLYLNTGFYPELLKYQAGTQAAFFCNSEFPSYNLIAKKEEWLLQYYFKNKVSIIDSADSLTRLNTCNDILIYADDELLNKLEKTNHKFEILKEFNQFHITGLTKEFFYYKTRKSVLQKRYLLSIN